MKVLVFTNMYPSKEVAFSGLFVKNQVDELQRQLGPDHTVHYLKMKRRVTSKFGSILKYLGYTVRFMPYFFKRYDVLHLHFVFPLFILAGIYKWLHPKTYLVFTWHGGDIQNFFASPGQKKLYRMFAEKTVDYTIAVGQDLANLIKERLGQESQIVMSAGVNHYLFYHEPNTPKQYDILFVGSFIDRKSVLEVIEAVKILGRKDLRIAFCGAGHLEPHIKTFIDEGYNASIHVNVPQQDLRAFFNASRFFICPSKFEAFGLVATEALYCGTPTITSPVGGLLGQIEHSVTGFVLKDPKIDPQDIANTLEQALSMDEASYAQMAENARNANQQYRLDSIMKKTIDIYQQGIQSKK